MTGHRGVVVGTYAGLSLRYRASASSRELGAEFARLYRSCATSEASGEPALGIELHEDEDGRRLRVGDEPALPVGDRNDLLLSAMTEIDRASVRASATDHLILHASAVLATGGPVLLVGPSGAGKSTLSAALTSCGWRYVGDEALGLADGATQVLANPKPWKLDRRSRHALADFGCADGSPAALDAEILVAPHELGEVCAPGWVGQPGAIVRVEFREGARCALSPMSRADAAELLADQCFNFALWGARALDTVAAAARRAAAMHLVFGDLRSAVAGLDQALR